MSLSSLFNLLAQVAFMVGVGFFLRRRGVIDDNTKRKLSEILLTVLLPLSVISTGNSKYSPQVARGLLWTALFTIAYFTFTLVLMRLITGPMSLSRADKGLLSALVVFANVTFVGYPMTYALFGDEGMLYAVVFNLGWQVFLSLFGVRLLDPRGRSDWKTVVRDPLLWAAVFSVALFVSPFRLPAVVVGAFDSVGVMSVPISMIIVGSNIAEIKLSSIFTLPGAYLVSGLRLFVLPLLMLWALWALGFRGPLAGTAVLMAAMPSGSMNLIFAERYGGNVKFAATALVQSMVFMVVSLPLLAILMEKVFS